MRAAELVRMRKRIREGEERVEKRLEAHPAGGDRVRQRLSLDVLHRDERDGPLLSALFECMDGGDIRVLQSSRGLGLAPKEAEPFGVVSHRRRKHLDGHFALQLSVAGEIDLTHAAFTESAKDAVVTELSSFFHQPLRSLAWVARLFYPSRSERDGAVFYAAVNPPSIVYTPPVQ